MNHKYKLDDCKGSTHFEEFSKIKFNYGENYDRIKFVNNDNLPIGKLIYFPAITVVIRCGFKIFFILKFI